MILLNVFNSHVETETNVVMSTNNIDSKQRQSVNLQCRLSKINSKIGEIDKVLSKKLIVTSKKAHSKRELPAIQLNNQHFPDILIKEEIKKIDNEIDIKPRKSKLSKISISTNCTQSTNTQSLKKKLQPIKISKFPNKSKCNDFSDDDELVEENSRKQTKINSCEPTRKSHSKFGTEITLKRDLSPSLNNIKQNMSKEKLLLMNVYKEDVNYINEIKKLKKEKELYSLEEYQSKYMDLIGSKFSDEKKKQLAIKFKDVRNSINPDHAKFRRKKGAWTETLNRISNLIPDHLVSKLQSQN